MGDFIEETPIKIEVNGRKFEIREPLGEEIDAIFEKMYKVKEDSRGKKNFEIVISERNKAYLKLVVSAPYEKDGKKFSELDSMQKLAMLNKLKPKLRGELLKKIDEAIMKGSDEEKKLSEQ